MLSLNILLKASNWMSFGNRTTEPYSTAWRPLIEALIEQSPVAGAKAFADAAAETSGCAPAGGRITVYSSPAWYSNMVGHKAVNREYFVEKYPQISFRYSVDTDLADGEFRAE